MRAALEESISRVVRPAGPMVTVEEAGYPKLAAIRVSLDGANAGERPPPRPQPPVGPVEPALEVENFAVSGRPILVQQARVELNCTARDVRLGQGPRPGWEPAPGPAGRGRGKGGGGGRAARSRGARARWRKTAADKQGVTVESVRIELQARSERALEVMVHVTAKKLFLSAALRISGSAEIDEKLTARLSGLGVCRRRHARHPRLRFHRAASGALQRAGIFPHGAAARRSETARRPDRGRTRAAGHGAVWPRCLTTRKFHRQRSGAQRRRNFSDLKAPLFSAILRLIAEMNSSDPIARAAATRPGSAPDPRPGAAGPALRDQLAVWISPRRARAPRRRAFSRLGLRLLSALHGLPRATSRAPVWAVARRGASRCRPRAMHRDGFHRADGARTGRAALGAGDRGPGRGGGADVGLHGHDAAIYRARLSLVGAGGLRPDPAPAHGESALVARASAPSSGSGC